MLSKAQKLQLIEDLDFTMLRQKACLPKPEGEGWTPEQAKLAETWYKRYLSVIVTHPNIAHVPNGPIDQFWHRHILDTRRYMDDCQAIFGQYIHHFPYYGLRGEADVEARDNSFDETNAAYREVFGEDCTIMGMLFSNNPYPKPNLPDLFDPDGTGEVILPGKETLGSQCHKCSSDVQCRSNYEVNAGENCNHGGSGTGCGQGCGNVQAEVGAGCGVSCGDGGSGRGCSIAKDPLSARGYQTQVVMAGVQCGHAGGGNGCGRGCHRQ